MSHLPSIITDLALILVIAGITTIIFKKLKQPVVLGYILAGFLVVPQFSLLPNVQDTNSISVWAEIGIIFLLFNLGLEFSVKKLANVAPVAAPTGVFEIVMMIATGYLVGGWLGWSQMDRMFLGGMLAISSTAIIIRAFDELNLKTKKFTGLVMGVLIIEDIVGVLLLVLLSTIAVSQNFEGSDLVFSMLRLAFFLILWFVVGILLIPTLLNKLKKYLDNETILVVAVGLCFAMVVMANQVGFSSALGAFLMGSILAETTFVERIEHQLKSLKNLFGAVFFVSVGMMINPVLLWENITAVLVLTLVVLLGKTIFISTGMLISGQPLKASVLSGMSMSQIGEFSFIIATLGLSLGVISEFLYPVAVGVSVITTFISPYFIRYSEPFYLFLERTLPPKWLTILDNYSQSSQQVQDESDWKKLVKSYFTIIVMNAVMAIGVITLGYRVLWPLVDNSSKFYESVFFIVVLLSILPFLWGLLKKKVLEDLYQKMWEENSINRGPLLSLKFARVIVSILVLAYLISHVISTGLAIGTALVILLIGITIFSNKISSYYHKIESAFYSNFNHKELAIKERSDRLKGLLPWDTHFADIQVSVASEFVGKTLQEIQLREKYNVNVAIIDRQIQKIYVPTKDVVILPGDVLTLIGDDEHLETVKNLFEKLTEDLKSESHEKIELGKLVVHTGDKIVGMTIHASHIREETHGMVLGLERNGEKDLNPSSGKILEEGDILWIVGDMKLIQKFTQEVSDKNPKSA
ncbi:MAG TPA: cation:proton antiporter [Chitinophagales bacterium]|nr:cation:proton antiporter [Chitinophagales bacterium]